MNATRALAAFAADLSYEVLPPSTVEMTRKLLLDGLGCLLVGTEGAPGKSAAATVSRLGGASQATVFIGNARNSVRNAAFANGVTLYSVGLNDIHKPSVSHPGGCIVPVVLAVGEWQGLDGRDLIAAMVAGYEVNGRVGRSIAPSHRERGFHPTGTCGAFGATAAAGRLLGLDAEMLASAYGITGSQAAGLYEFHHDGTLTMIFHAGRSAQNGVEACLLAQDGLTGPATVIEGSKGFCRATSNAFDEDSLTERLGEEFLIEETSFRPYYGCSSTIAASGALESVLRRSGNDNKEVEKIAVHCHPVVAKDNAEPDPRTLLGARLSMNYNLALVVHRRAVLTGDLGDTELNDPAIRRWLPKVELLADDVPRFGSRVVVRFADGSTDEESNLTPRGEPGNPLTWEDVEDKFLRMAVPIVGENPARHVVEIVGELESRPVADLVAALSSALDRRKS